MSKGMLFAVSLVIVFLTALNLTNAMPMEDRIREARSANSTKNQTQGSTHVNGSITQNDTNWTHKFEVLLYHLNEIKVCS